MVGVNHNFWQPSLVHPNHPAFGSMGNCGPPKSPSLILPIYTVLCPLTLNFRQNFLAELPKWCSNSAACWLKSEVKCILIFRFRWSVFSKKGIPLANGKTAHLPSFSIWPLKLQHFETSQIVLTAYNRLRMKQFKNTVFSGTIII